MRSDIFAEGMNRPARDSAAAHTVYGPYPRVEPDSVLPSGAAKMMIDDVDGVYGGGEEKVQRYVDNPQEQAYAA